MVVLSHCSKGVKKGVTEGERREGSREGVREGGREGRSGRFNYHFLPWEEEEGGTEIDK